MEQCELSLANYARVLTKGILAKQEQALCEAINHNLGTDKWNLEYIAGRCNRVIEGDNQRETFYFDGEPLIEFYKVEVVDNGDVFSLQRKFKVLCMDNDK